MPRKGKRIKKLNNKGFTLIEVLAVIVILVIILAIAIPNISASLDRQACKTTENKIELIKSATKLYVSDNRNAVKSKLSSPASNKCKITIDNLETYLDADDLKDGEGDDISGSVVVDSSYNYYFCNDNDNCSLNDSGKCGSISELNKCVS